MRSAERLGTKAKRNPRPSSFLADSIAVAGDGAVGIAVAVALSSEVSRVILAGPPGTTETMGRFSAPHWRKDPVEILHTAIDHVPPVNITIAALKAYDIREASVHIPSPVICLSNGMGLSAQWGPFPFPVEYAPITTGFRKTGLRSVEVSAGRVCCRTGGMAWNLFKDTLPGVEGVEDIAPHRWAKWYANSIINPIGALTGLPNNRLEGSHMGHFIEELEQELAPLMPTEESLFLGKGMLHWLLEKSPNRCSMLQDLENHRPTEIDFLTGYAVRNHPGHCPAAGYITSEIRSRT